MANFTEPPIKGEILISSYEQLSFIITNNSKVFIRFFDTHCQLCKQMTPLFQQLIDNTPDIVFCSIFCASTPDIARIMNAEYLPYFVSYFNGQPQASFVGSDFNSYSKMIQDLSRL